MENQVKICFSISFRQLQHYLLSWGQDQARNPMGIGSGDQKMEFCYKNSSVSLCLPIVPSEILDPQTSHSSYKLFAFSTPVGGQGLVDFYVNFKTLIPIMGVSAEEGWEDESRIQLSVQEDFTSCEIRVNTNPLVLKHIFEQHLKDS